MREKYKMNMVVDSLYKTEYEFLSNNKTFLNAKYLEFYIYYGKHNISFKVDYDYKVKKHRLIIIVDFSKNKYNYENTNMLILQVKDDNQMYKIMNDFETKYKDDVIFDSLYEGELVVYHKLNTTMEGLAYV